MRDTRKTDEVLFGRSSENIQKLWRQARRETRLAKRKQWKEQNEQHNRKSS